MPAYSLYPSRSYSNPPDAREPMPMALHSKKTSSGSTAAKRGLRNDTLDTINQTIRMQATKEPPSDPPSSTSPNRRPAASDRIERDSDAPSEDSVELDREEAAPSPTIGFRRREVSQGEGAREDVREQAHVRGYPRGLEATNGNANQHSLRAQMSRGSSVISPDKHDAQSIAGSIDTYSSSVTSMHTLPALQAKGGQIEPETLEPVMEDDPASYNLIAPPDEQTYREYSLEQRGLDMFSRQHLDAIFEDPSLLLRFTTFLGQHRPRSVPTLIYYLDALKALRAIKYANAVAEALEPIEACEFTKTVAPPTRNSILEEKAREAFDVLAREDLPAYVTSIFVSTVSQTIQKRITGTLPPHLRESSEGLAEVFCLSDPSRPDNPLVFASEEFHRTTQYGMGYTLGKNCRFLQGPSTDRNSIRRLREAIETGKDHSETFVNYRRDGSPFLNLLMMAPLRDSRGVLRYFIGAQVDVSGLAKECSGLPGLQAMLAQRAEREEREENNETHEDKRDQFQELSEMFNLAELDIVKKCGGRMHREHVEEDDGNASWHRPRLLLKDPSPGDDERLHEQRELGYRVHGKLIGVYQNYLLVRPYPSLRILFTSPSLRVPGILQSPFMNRIGSSERVRDELIAALAEGRGVTAKVRWVSRNDDEGRNRWIHCTPLLGHNGNIGVWMIVLVDDESSRPSRRFRTAPPVAPHIKGTSDSISQGKRSDSDRPDTAMSNQRTGSMLSQSEYDVRIR